MARPIDLSVQILNKGKTSHKSPYEVVPWLESLTFPGVVAETSDLHRGVGTACKYPTVARLM